MADEVQPTSPTTPVKWLTWIPEPVKKYGTQVVLWLIACTAVYISARYGLPAPPAPVVMVDAPKEEPVVQAVESPTQFYCGRQESITDSYSTRPWPVKKITWNIDVSEYRGTISTFSLKEAFTVAWASWAAHIDIEPTYIADANKALVICKFGNIDGSGRVLAWSELADGTLTPKHQLYDNGEKWEIAAQPSQIDLVRVAAHEIGHVLGLVHDTEDSGTLLAPIYSRSIRFPTTRDAKRLLAMGYPERPIPPGEKPSIPPLSITIDATQILKALEQAGYEVKKK